MFQDNRINVQGYGSLLLHFAVCLPNTDIALHLIRLIGANINIRTDNVVSVLHRAIQYNNSQQVELLLEHGADVTLKTDDGDTPLHYSGKRFRSKFGGCDFNDWQKQKYNIYKLLLEKGADCNEKNNEGSTPFLAAVSSRSLEIVELLMNNEADVKAIDSKGRTALHCVMENGYEEVIEFILGRVELRMA